MVRIRAFQAWGPGSIPGRRTFVFKFKMYDSEGPVV